MELATPHVSSGGSVLSRSKAALTPPWWRAHRTAVRVRSLERQVAALAAREQALAALAGRLARIREEDPRQTALDLHDDPVQRAILLVRRLDVGLVGMRERLRPCNDSITLRSGKCGGALLTASVPLGAQVPRSAG